MTQDIREFECVVLGATGYTGRFVCEHITTQLPTNFRWAIAGRSASKLESVVDDLKRLKKDRVTPAVEVVQLEKNELVALAKRTKVLATTVGPYHKYGAIVFEACAEIGTHYLDVTGEIPWVCEMVQKYDATAKRSGAIMISQDGIESAPADLMCWMLASHIRETLKVGTRAITLTGHDMNASASGGTLSSALTIFDTYSSSQFAKASDPWSLCPADPTRPAASRPLLEKLTGVRYVNGLGTLTDSLQGPADLPIIHKSRLLYGESLYGKNFFATAYMTARNAFTGFAFHLALAIGMAILALKPFRLLLKNFVYQPGEGPSKEQGQKEFVEWRAIATAETNDPDDPKQAFGRMRWNGSMYRFTGICLAESALILAREKTFAHELGGGCMTPATLGAKLLEALRKAGLEAEVKTMP